MTAGLDRRARTAFDREIRAALSEGDARFFDELTQSIFSQTPERAEKIKKAAEYLKKYMSGIAICAQDAEANNGGATGPHVRHVPASRLIPISIRKGDKRIAKGSTDAFCYPFVVTILIGDW